MPDDAHDLMEAMHIRHVPVVTRDNELVGMVSQRDLLQSGLFPPNSPPTSELTDELREMTVRQVMERNVEAVFPHTSLEEAGLTMLEHNLGCLPVVDSRRVIGILTQTDFVRYAVDQLQERRALPFRKTA